MILVFTALHIMPCMGSFTAIFATGDIGAFYTFIILTTVTYLFWLSYDRMQKSLKGGLGLSFVLVSVDWLLVCLYLVNVVLFVNKSSINVIDPPSSPLAALLGIVTGLFWSIVLSIMMAMGILEIIRARSEKRSPAPGTPGDLVAN
ncbi:MAG: hypothetical protein ACYC1M_08890 [Armatimonadota bacterium]